MAELSRRHPQVVPIVTATTRERREGELDKVHYHFLSPEEFQQLRDRDGLLEHAVVHDHWYGTPVDQVRGILAAGRDAILTIDPQGARSVRALVPDALLIFIKPPSIEDLDQRLARRGSEDGKALALRRHNAEAEMAAADDYDYAIVNQTDHPERRRRADLGDHPGRSQARPTAARPGLSRVAELAAEHGARRGRGARRPARARLQLPPPCRSSATPAPGSLLLVPVRPPSGARLPAAGDCPNRSRRSSCDRSRPSSRRRC